MNGLKTLREQISLSIDGKMIIFNELKKGDDLLFLYGPKARIHHVFQLFIDTGLKNGELCLYAFDSKNNIIDFDNAFFQKYIKEGKLHLLPIEEKTWDGFNNKLGELCIKSRNYSGIRILVDFADIANPTNIDRIIDCENEIAEKTKKRVSGQWNKKYSRYDDIPFPIIAISAFNVASLDTETVRSLIKLHKKVIISTQSQSIAYLLNSNDGYSTPSMDALPEKMMEQLVKNNIDAIVLSILKQQPMCGYDVIKTIFKRFHIFLSQGTLYPLLYDLEKKGLLKAEIQSDNRTKVYTPTENGKKTIDNVLSDFIKVHEYLLSSMKQRSTTL